MAVYPALADPRQRRTASVISVSSAAVLGKAGGPGTRQQRHGQGGAIRPVTCEDAPKINDPANGLRWADRIGGTDDYPPDAVVQDPRRRG